MIIFNDGYVIVDVSNGNLIEYSLGDVKQSLEKIEKMYTIGFLHYGVDQKGQIIEGRGFKNKNIDEVKSKMKVKDEKLKSEKQNRKWKKIKFNEAKELINIYYGANEGEERDEFITNPELWLLRYYADDAASNLEVQKIDSYDVNVSEIDQDDWDPYSEDCAIISTLEILNYFYSVSDSEEQDAYDEMTSSNYFNEDKGVSYYNNNELFTIATEAIGEAQQDDNNDIEKLGLGYSRIKEYLQDYGPGYLSMAQDPYGAHTVTVKGVEEYKTTYRDEFYIDRTKYDHFIRINDHWNITTDDAFLNLNRSASSLWYYTFLTVEDE